VTSSANPRRRRFSELPSFRLHILAGLSERYAELRYQREFGLRMREVRIIGVVGFHGAPTFGYVCKEAELEKSHASRLVGGLIKRGLLTRAADPDDSRSILLSLTARGRAVYGRIFDEALDRNERILSALTPAQRAALATSIEILIERIRGLWVEDRGDAAEGEPHIPGAAQSVAATAAGAPPQQGVLLDAALAGELYRQIGAALAAAPPG
jgi:DNA-binding MarR family transcriptional regulator